MKIAAIEFNDHHDEVLPSVVYALNQLDVEPDVYISERAIRNDAFSGASGLRYRLVPIDGSGFLGRVRARGRGTPSRFRRYEALFINSVEPLPVLQIASRIDLPTIAVVHNADLLRDDGPYARFFADPKRQPIFLGRHVAASLGMAPGKGWLGYFFFGEVEPERPDGDDRTILCVPGNVEYVRRDYAALLAAVESVASERTDFRVMIVGRSQWRDGRDLRSQVDARGLTDHFVFSEPDIPQPRFLSLVAAADFILPLIDPVVPGLAPYFSVKITSSMSMSIGLGVVPIAEASLAALYGAEPAAVTHPSGRLVEGIRAALDMSPGDRSDRVKMLGGIRSEALASSVANLADALASVGVPTA